MINAVSVDCRLIHSIQTVKRLTTGLCSNLEVGEMLIQLR